MDKDTSLRISYEFDPTPGAEDRLLEIFEFLLQEDKERIGLDRNDATISYRK